MSASVLSLLTDAKPTFSILSLMVPLPFLLLAARPNNPEMGKFSLYLFLSTFFHTWACLTILLYVLPMFGKHNSIIAFSLFFPAFVTSLGLFFTTKALSKLIRALKNRGQGLLPRAEMPWFRPLRTIFLRAFTTTLLTCLTQALCWSRSTHTFKSTYADGGPVCEIAFESDNNGPGAIWRAYAYVAMWMAADLAVRTIWGNRPPAAARPTRGATLPPTRSASKSISTPFKFSPVEDEEDDLQTKEEEGAEGDEDDQDHHEDQDEHEDPTTRTIRPTDTEVMVPWYSLLLVFTAVDILIQLKVFLGRFDARTLQPANHHSWGGKRKKQLPLDDEREESAELSGCVFDYSTKRGSQPEGSSEEEIWFDWMADCGEGFNSSYQVARVLADPKLTVLSGNRKETRTLPRGEFLVVGGDLAYPDPNEYNFERRFFRTFEDAMPPPPAFRRENISVMKPNLPVKGWSKASTFKNSASDDDAHALLNKYKGPQAFVLPGNHDWFDGLGTFMRYVASRDWLGGWLMPQERSYFCIMLPQGWWIFGIDLALSEDIDVEQYKFFADIARRRVKEGDAVVIMTHEPYWVLDTSEKRGEDKEAMYEFAEKNLRELMFTHLKGKVRARIAGDLHHYTRHVPVRKPQPNARPSETYTPNSDGGNLAVAAKRMARRARAGLPPNGDEGWDENLPEMIVSGGGGAFLHPTHTFDKNISCNFGPKKNRPYFRSVAYPSDSVSFRLSFLNIWQFRWRNWRMDILLGILYLGLVYSLIPLCGVFASYKENASDKGALAHVVWYSGVMSYLVGSLFRGGILSTVVFCATLYGFLSYCDETMPTKYRIPWGMGHGAAHIVAAMSCCIFIELAIEWGVDMGFTSSAGVSMVQEFEEKFSSGLWKYAPSILSNEAAGIAKEHLAEGWMGLGGETGFLWLYDMLAVAFNWVFNNMPGVQRLMFLFDLPGQLSADHVDMCKALCEGGKECLGVKDALLWAEIPRLQISIYGAGWSLYFFIIAIPCAGSIFGSWLAFTLTIFNGQWNEGFSSLRIQHWKNVIRCHIKKNGDLEIFAIGLDRVPKKWRMDEKWSGTKVERAKRERERVKRGLVGGEEEDGGDVASFQWSHPSKWIPEKENIKHIPRLIDHTVIPKRVARGGDGGGSLEGDYAKFVQERQGVDLSGGDGGSASTKKKKKAKKNGGGEGAIPDFNPTLASATSM